MVSNEKSHNNTLNNISNYTSVLSSHKIRLAPTALPKFDSNIQEWQLFFDCFKSMVHNDDSTFLCKSIHTLSLL